MQQNSNSKCDKTQKLFFYKTKKTKKITKLKKKNTNQS